MLTARETDFLLSELCTRLGFCLPPAAHDEIRKAPPANVDEFAVAVLVAEGLDPSTADRNLYRRVRELVAQAFKRSADKRRDA